MHRVRLAVEGLGFRGLGFRGTGGLSLYGEIGDYTWVYSGESNGTSTGK